MSLGVHSFTKSRVIASSADTSMQTLLGGNARGLRSSGDGTIVITGLDDVNVSLPFVAGETQYHVFKAIVSAGSTAGCFPVTVGL